MASSPGISREAFVGRVRGALGRSGPPAEPPRPPAVDEALVRLTRADEDLLSLFTQRAEGVGAAVWRCERATLADRLVEALGSYGVTSVTLAESQLPDVDAVTEALKQGGIEVRDWRDDRGMAGHYDAGAGVTGGLGLAETGTVIYRSGEGGGRGHMLVPPVHVVVLKRSDILPDMVDYWARQRGRSGAELPASQSMITGPSKTADIEGVLITGVHGPGKVGIVIVEDA